MTLVELIITDDLEARVSDLDPQPPFIDREGSCVAATGVQDRDGSTTRSSSSPREYQGTSGLQDHFKDRVRHFSWTKPLAPGHHHFVQRDDASVPSECGFVVLSEPDGCGGATVFDCNLPASDLVHIAALLDYQAAQVKSGFGNQATCANCGSAAAAHQVRAQ